MPSQNSIFTPELLKILKIFGIASIAVVLLLSFFDSRRANNTGDDLTFRMSDASRIYFLNVKSAVYDREIRADAGMSLFRHEKLISQDQIPSLNLLLILNPLQDEAYLYLEPLNHSWPVTLEIIRNSGKSQRITLNDGNKFQHLESVELLKPFLLSDAQFFLTNNGNKYPLWAEDTQRKAVKRIFEDYFRLIEP